MAGGLRAACPPARMLSFGNGISTVIPGKLLLGSAQHETDYAMLRERQVTHILQVGSELRPSHPQHFTYLHVGMEDVEQEDLVQRLPRCRAFIDEAVSNGGVVLVHCMAGISRSSSVCIAYLMAADGLSFDAAFKQVKLARPCVYPNLGFLFQLWELEKEPQLAFPNEAWQGWNKHRFAERLALYRQEQQRAGVHPAVRVRLPRTLPAGPRAMAAAEGQQAELPAAAPALLAPS